MRIGGRCDSGGRQPAALVHLPDRYREVARDLRAQGTPFAVASPALIIAFTAMAALLIVALLFLF